MKRSQQHLIETYLEKIFPHNNDLMWLVTEEKNYCRVKVGNKTKLFFSQNIYHPHELLLQRFQNYLNSLRVKLTRNRVNHSLIKRIKRFEFFKTTRRVQKKKRYLFATKIQQRETEFNLRRAEFKLTNPLLNSTKKPNRDIVAPLPAVGENPHNGCPFTIEI